MSRKSAQRAKAAARVNQKKASPRAGSAKGTSAGQESPDVTQEFHAVLRQPEAEFGEGTILDRRWGRLL